MKYEIRSTIYKKKAAFTMIEVLMSLSMMVIVILAVTTLTIHGVRINQRNVENLQAQYFAIEALEAIRGIRDSNKLQNYFWLGKNGQLWEESFEKIPAEGAYYVIKHVDFISDTKGPWTLKKVDIENDNLKIKDTKFDRYIFIKPLIANDEGYYQKVYVQTVVNWSYHGRQQSTSLFTNFTDWN